MKTGRTAKRSDIFRKLNTQYRVVFIDDESLEEKASYRLTMGKLYTVLSTIFVSIVLITVGITLATPLKYYIPGYGSEKDRLKVIKLKRQVDSLSDLASAQHKYEENLRSIINGDVAMVRDTAMLNMQLVKQEEINSILSSKQIRKDAIESIKRDNKKQKQTK